MKMSHEEYIQKQRNRAVAVARGMLDGSIHYLEGAVELSSLRFEIGLPENDSNFLAFTAVVSEIEQSMNWAKEFSLSNCKSIIERFSA